MPQYTSLVLGWPLSTVNLALALKALVSAVFLFMLPAFRARYLEPRMATGSIDLLITEFALLTNTIGIIGLGFSVPAGFFLLALCVYQSGTGLADSLHSYGTLTLPPGENISEFYVRTNLVATLTGLIGAPFWSNIFSWILRSESLPLGLPFWVSAVLFGIGFLCTRVLKRWNH